MVLETGGTFPKITGEGKAATLDDIFLAILEKHPAWKMYDCQHLTIEQTQIALGIGTGEAAQLQAHEERWAKIFEDAALELKISTSSLKYWPRDVVVKTVAKLTGDKKPDSHRIRVALLKWKPK